MKTSNVFSRQTARFQDVAADVCKNDSPHPQKKQNLNMLEAGEEVDISPLVEGLL